MWTKAEICVSNRTRDFGSFLRKILSGYYTPTFIKVMKRDSLDV